jgi:hypothetical protein
MSTIRVDKLTNRLGNGAPEFINGAQVTGDTSITGDASITGNTSITGDASITGDVNITGITTSTNFSISGEKSTTDGNILVDASATQYYSHIASFTNNRSVLVSNLTPGRWVQIYIRNTNATARTITVQASGTDTSHTNVNLALSTTSGTTSVVSFSLAATSGTAVIWVANIDGDIVGSVV